MYIFELAYKIINRIKNPQPLEIKSFEDEYKSCSHVFVPIDSTKKVLACTKCGIIKRSKEIKTES